MWFKAWENITWSIINFLAQPTNYLNKNLYICNAKAILKICDMPEKVNCQQGVVNTSNPRKPL